MENTMVKGPILVKAKKIGESDDGYYLEFELTGAQKDQFLADLMLRHKEQGTLTITKENNNSNPALEKMKFLENLLKDKKAEIPEEIRNEFYKMILDLSKSS